MAKQSLPPEIKAEMEAAREGLIPLPQSYIDFHAALAQAHLALLTHYLPLVVDPSNSPRMVADGWFLDRMQVMQVHALLGGEPVTLVWHDGNQEFFLKHSVGGSSPLRLNVNVRLT
jgi:hypothetical protein